MKIQFDELKKSKNHQEGEPTEQQAL